MATVLITGNTYPVRERLKALGAKWDPTAKGWRVDESRADEARLIVDAAGPAKSAARSGRPRYWRPCGYPGCSPRYCDECDGQGDISSRRYR